MRLSAAKTRLCLSTLALGVSLFTTATSAPAAAQDASETVSVELVLLVDTSSSVDNNEFWLQRQGYINAFRNDQVQQAILSNENGIAVRMAYWATANNRDATEWFVLRSISDCEAFADAVAGFERSFGGETHMAPAIDWAIDQLVNNDIDSARRVIDVSGDGICENQEAALNGTYNPDIHGPRTWDEVIADLGSNLVVFNGISIGENSVANWYEANVPHGDGNFVLHSASFENFGEGIRKKLIREINPTFLDALYD